MDLLRRRCTAARVVLVVVTAAATACSRAEGPLPASSWPPLQTLLLPDLSSSAAPVQAQIRERYASFQSVNNHAAKSTGELAAAYGEMGKLLTAARYFDAAEIAFLNARTLGPHDMRWPYLLGHVHRFQNEPTAAAAAFEHARMLAPDHVPTLVWLAELHLAASRPDQAEALLIESRTVAPESAVVRFGLGRAALAQRDHATAVEHLEAALAAAPSATRVHYPLALAYRGLGDRANAEAHLRLRGEADIPAVDPLLDEVAGLLREAAYEARGAEALDAGRWREAAGDLRKALERNPDNSFTRLNLGTALYMLGDADGALDQYREAVRLSPGQARAHFGIGVVMESRGEDTAAIDAFKSAVQGDPGYVEARFSLANALRRNGRIRDSLLHYDEVLRANPAVSQASFGYAMGLVRLGRYREARDRIERDVRLFPDQPGFPHALARLMAAAPDDRVRDGARALVVARTLLDMQRTSSLAETMAMALAELGRFDEAVVWQREAMDLARQSGRTRTAWHMENLRRYERGLACRMPWPDDDPVHHPAAEGRR
jgi:tetratricopeptide (TPR) repeat protein